MQEKGIILSMWGWGYTLTQMPGGTLTQRIGGKKTWLMAFTLSSVTSTLIPTAGYIGGVAAITVLNFMSGMGQAPAPPPTTTTHTSTHCSPTWSRLDHSLPQATPQIPRTFRA